MKGSGPRAASDASGAVRFTSTGFGVEPCSECGGRLLPGQLQATMPGVWRAYHVTCPVTTMYPCSVCGDTDHSDGMCLI